MTGKSTDSSDIDFVVEFDRQGFKGAFDQFMGFKLELESVLERLFVLLVNWPFRNSVFQEKALFLSAGQGLYQEYGYKENE